MRLASRTWLVMVGGFQFANCMFFDEVLLDIEAMPDSTASETISKYAEMSIAYSFMEGNGRATRIWLDMMLKKWVGMCVDWRLIGTALSLSSGMCLGDGVVISASVPPLPASCRNGNQCVNGFGADSDLLRPDLAVQWRPTLNRGLKPADVMLTNGKQVWWRGPCGHGWKAKVSARAKPKVSTCPYCAGRRQPERPVDLG